MALAITLTKGAYLPVLPCATFIFYRLSIILYRLFLHPLAKFPGPKIAAVTSLYEAYHEIVLNGQYSKKISELHDLYGEPETHWIGTRTALIKCRPYRPSNTP